MKKTERLDFSYTLTKFFTIYLPAQRNVSSNTVNSYRDAFKLFLQFISETKNIKPNNISLTMISRSYVEEYLLWLETNRHCSKKTCNQRLGAIHAFFAYVQYECPEHALLCQQVLSIRTKKAPEAIINYLTIDGIKVLLAQPDLSTKEGRRDLAILSIMYDTGARVSEIADLKYSDVRFIIPATVRITGKGNKTRVVPLLTHTKSILESYTRDYKFTRRSPDCPLFLNRDNEQLTRFGIGYILKKYVSTARQEYPELIPEKITPHCIRHSKAMHLLQANVNLIYIRDLLGHTDIKTTEMYARVDTTLKREALEKANPIKNEPNMPEWNNDRNLMDWLRDLGK